MSMAGHHVCVVELCNVPKSYLEKKHFIGNISEIYSSIIVVEILKKKRKDWLIKGHFQKFSAPLKYTNKFLDEHKKWYEHEIDALEAKERLMVEFSEMGFCVLDNNEKKHCVYIVDLDERVKNVSSFKKANKDCGYEPERYLYIGQTSESPKIRFQKHKTRSSGSNIVKEHGLKLAEDLMAIHSQYGLTKLESLNLEKSLTTMLRNETTKFATYSK